MESRAAALLELAVAATRARLIATDGRRRGRRSRGRSEVLPSSRFPAVLAFEFSLLFPELPAFGGFLRLRGQSQITDIDDDFQDW